MYSDSPYTPHDIFFIFLNFLGSLTLIATSVHSNLPFLPFYQLQRCGLVTDRRSADCDGCHDRGRRPLEPRHQRQEQAGESI